MPFVTPESQLILYWWYQLQFFIAASSHTCTPVILCSIIAGKTFKRRLPGYFENNTITVFFVYEI